MKGFPEEFDSIFRYIEVVSQRATQLIHGAHPRSESSRAKPTLLARDEVDSGLVPWRILTQEELEARRQALVEEFRAEMTPEGDTPKDEFPEDVLPTSEAPAPVAEVELQQPEDHDEDLLRLQRLIGFGGEAPTPDEESPEVVEEPDSEEHAED